MDSQKEALHRIITTLAKRQEELHTFIETLRYSLTSLQSNTSQVLSDLEEEFDTLFSILYEMKESMANTVKQEQTRKMQELQNQLTQSSGASESSAELLAFANNAMLIRDGEDFMKAAKHIRDSATQE